MINISKKQGIPFKDENGDILQMLEFEVRTSITQLEGETQEELQTRSDKIFEEEVNKMLLKDNHYQKKVKQLNYIVEVLKKELGIEKTKKIILDVKKI